MCSGDRLVKATAAALSAANAVLWLAWGAAPSDAFAIVILLITAIATVPMAMVAPRERRALAVLLVLVAPIVGPVAAAAAILARGRGGQDLLLDPAAKAQRLDGVGLARKLTRARPPCEALVSHDLELRRATIARLTARANAEDLTMLRWAKTRQDPELSVEIALALEDIDQRFEAKLRAARADAGLRPSAATHRAVFELISDGILAGVVDVPLVGKLASEARIHYDAAVRAQPEVRTELLGARARFEIAVRRPELVLALLEDTVNTDPRSELVALYIDAAYAMRAFDVIATLEARLADAA